MCKLFAMSQASLRDIEVKGDLLITDVNRDS